MGACISINHKASAMKAQVSFDSTNKPDHSIRKVVALMDGHVAVKPQLPPSHSFPRFSDYGSKEETYFDSQAWLDSDYEDEFMSVNDEFTPSRGNTPMHHGLFPSRPDGTMAQPLRTPTEKRKSLLDFFKESLRENHGSFNGEYAEPPNKYGDKLSSNKDGLCLKRERPAGFMPGCFTGLLSVGSTGSQNKKSSVSGLKVAHSSVVGS